MRRRTFLRASTAAGLSTPALAAPPARSGGPVRFQVLMFDGVEEQDFVAPVEVLGLAAQLSSGALAAPVMVTSGRPGVVTCTFGTKVEVPKGWSPQEADVLVVPGGGYRNREGPGVHRLIADREFLGRLAGVRALVAAICTGTMVLSAAGLTRARNVTTHARARADLAAQGATVIDARVVDDGNLVTSGGITGGLDLALWLVERFAGARLAQSAETVLEYERRGTVWRA